DLVKVPTYRWLIDQEYLVPPVVFAPVRPDLKGVRTLDTGDYSPSELETRMNTNALVGGIVEHWFRLGQSRPTIVFTSGVKHSAHLQREFRAAGVEAEHKYSAGRPQAHHRRVPVGQDQSVVQLHDLHRGVRRAFRVLPRAGAADEIVDDVSSDGRTSTSPPSCERQG